MKHYEHGHPLKYIQGCDCDPCHTAYRRYEKQRRHERKHGHMLLIPSTGTVRRLEALAVMGWSMRDLEKRIGLADSSLNHTVRYMRTNGRVHRAKAEKVAALYDELCMLQGPSRIARERAEKKGWRGPLAWDDDTIDDPAAKPYRPATADQTLVDDVLVQRILDGDRDLAKQANKAEKCEVARRWLAAGRSLSSLEWTGWRVERYRPRATPDGRWVQVGNRRVWESA